MLIFYFFFFSAVVDSESHFSFCMILGTILNISIAMLFIEESPSVLKLETFSVRLSLL